MATTGDLAKSISVALGLPPNAVSYPLRCLRDAGLISKGKRGKGGAVVTPRDAASVLIAAVGGLPTKDVVESFQEYADLPAGGAWDLSDFPITALQALPSNHAFRDALVALIEAVAGGGLNAAVEIRMFAPWPQAAVRIVVPGTFSEERHYRSVIRLDRDAVEKWEADYRERYGDGDLQQVRIFTQKTILAVGELLTT